MGVVRARQRRRGRRRQRRGGGGKAAAATQRRRGRRQRQRRPRVAGALLNGPGGMWATDFKHHGAKVEAKVEG